MAKTLLWAWMKICVAGIAALVLVMLAIAPSIAHAADKNTGQKNFLRYHDNSDGTVSDLKTGLQWARDAGLKGRVPWQFAVKYINEMNAGTVENYGFRDWRLPTIRELMSMMDKGRFYPSISEGHPFNNVQNGLYWSSTGGFNIVSYVWMADMSTGSIKYDYVSFCNFQYFWPVRGISNLADLAQPKTEAGVAGQDMDFAFKGGGACKDGGAMSNPFPPTVLTATAVSPNEIIVSWDAPEGADAISWYNIYENNTLIKSESSLSARIKGIDAATSHCYEVASLGSSGVESPKSRQGCTVAWSASANGAVWSLGINDYGQLADGTHESKGQLTTAHGISGVVDVSAGLEHTLAVEADGTVWAWGRNLKGQLGDGSTRDSSVPVQVKGLTNVESVAAGWYHSVALKKDGTVWAWGRNYYGQLGDGKSADSMLPVQVKGLSDVVQVAAGWYHTIALKKDGTVWAWGWNLKGQIGALNIERSLLPVQVGGINDAAKISAGMYHSLVLLKDGQVLAWGWNEYGQLGDGSTMDSYTPVKAAGLSSVTDIDGGMHHSVALRADGTVWAWGRNDYGQVSANDTPQYPTAVQVTGLPAKSAAVSAGAHHSAALGADGSLWVWGWLYGDKQTISNVQRRGGLDGITKLSSGLNFTAVIK